MSSKMEVEVQIHEKHDNIEIVKNFKDLQTEMEEIQTNKNCEELQTEGKPDEIYTVIPTDKVHEEIQADANLKEGQTNGKEVKIQIDRKWIGKRKSTFVLLALQTFSLGLEYVLVQSTLLPYIIDDMKASPSDFWYGIISSSRFIIPVLFCTVISRWYDKHRKLQLCVLLVNIANVMGYLLYMIPTSPLFALSGAILQGSCYVLQGLINSEILRVYDHDEVQGMFLFNLIALGLGETAGAVCGRLIEKVDFWIGHLHIIYGNAPSLILIVLAIIKIILSYLFVYDVSREFDLKRERTRIEESGHIEEITLTSAESSSSPQTTATSATTTATAKSTALSSPWMYDLQNMLQYDTVLLLVQQLYTGVFISLLPRVIPVIMQYLHYNALALRLAFVGVSLSTICISLIMHKMNLSSLGIYYCGISSLLSFLLLDITVLILRQHFIDFVNYVLIIVFVILIGFSWITDSIYIPQTLGKMYYSSHQSFIESTRQVVAMITALIGSFCAAYAYKHFSYWFPGFAIAIVLLLVGMVFRRKTLSNPTIIRCF